MICNEMNAQQELPRFYWNGRTVRECLSQAIGQTLEHGYAHQVQRLMVTGLYALLLGVPQRSGQANRRKHMFLYDVLLGSPRSSRGRAARDPATEPADPEPCSPGPRRAQRDRLRGRGGSREPRGLS